MSLAPLSSYGAVSPQMSRAIDNDGEKYSRKYDQETRGEIEKNLSSDNDKTSHKLPFQVYLHYAKIQRDFEKDRNYDELYKIQEDQIHNDSHANLSQSKLDSQRALRLASIYSVFFLITTDILGPSNAPYAIAQMGYVPGVILYIVFGVFAAFGGYMLNYCYCLFDSNNYPIRTFSDLAGRAVDWWFRYPIAILHFIQLIMNVGLILLSTGVALAEVVQAQRSDNKNTLCFVVEVIVWAFLGIILGQIRHLGNFAHIANSAVWMNVAICVITMVAAATEEPYYQFFIDNFGKVAPYTEPIAKHAITPGDLSQRIQGMNNMVFAWGGATIFCEVMAELKRPMDFWKGMIMAQAFILVVYLFYGLFTYSYWGQYCYTSANLGISNTKLQTAANILSMLSGILAAVMYGNVGLKVLYQGFLVPDLGFPKLTTKTGTVTWSGLTVVYWMLAFVIGCAIPQISSLVSIISSFCIFNFSYTFPTLFALCVLVKIDASSEDVFDLGTFTVIKHDTWLSFARWKRGIFKGGWFRFCSKIALFLLFLACLATCGICAYSAIEGAIQTYSASVATSFGCRAPT